MAYSEIMKSLLKVTAVKAVGKLLLTAFMAVVCTAIQGDSCADFASALRVAVLGAFPFAFSHLCQMLQPV